MKPSTSPSLRHFRSSRRIAPISQIPISSPALSPITQHRTFATTSSCREGAATDDRLGGTGNKAESSTQPYRPGKGEAYPGESQEDAFRRNLKEVQAWRRRKESLHIKTPFIPPSATPPKPPPTHLQASLSTLLATGAALGHSSATLHPHYAPYIFGTRAGLSIIDLDQTLPLLRRAAALVRDVVKADGVVLFVGDRAGIEKALRGAKERLGDNGFVTGRWLPGLLTNSDTLFGLEPVKNRSAFPDLVVFLNPGNYYHAIRECTSRSIPTIGIVDSDLDPRIVTYAIPANMESIRTQELILGTLSLAGQEGRRLRLKEEEANKAKAFSAARRTRNYDEDRENRDGEYRSDRGDRGERRGGGYERY